MKAEEFKTAIKACVEISENRKTRAQTITEIRRQACTTKKLCREGNKSRLAQIGVALIVFPEPTPISETIGAGFMAAAAIQKGIKSRSIYLEDIAKAYKNAFKEIANTRYEL